MATVQCPACNASLRVPESLFGKRVKCPKCEGMFVAATDAPAAYPTLPPPSAPAYEELDRPYQDDGEDDFDRPRRRRRRTQGGAVTAIAVVNFVLGGLVLLCGVIAFGVGAVVGGVIFQGQKGAADLRPLAGLGGFFAGLLIAFALLYLLVGTLLIVAGVGVVKRRPWGRILSLVLGGITAVFALLSAFGIATGNLGSCVTLLVFGGYTVLVYVILLNRDNAAEFR